MSKQNVLKPQLTMRNVRNDRVWTVELVSHIHLSNDEIYNGLRFFVSRNSLAISLLFNSKIIYT